MMCQHNTENSAQNINIDTEFKGEIAELELDNENESSKGKIFYSSTYDMK